MQLEYLILYDEILLCMMKSSMAHFMLLNSIRKKGGHFDFEKSLFLLKFYI